MSVQLALSLRLRESASFANFQPAQNAEAVDCLRRALEAVAAGRAGERVIFLCGATGSGRTHLLQAACHRMQELGPAYAYVPLREVVNLAPVLLDGLESAPLVCLDDVEAIAGVRAWEDAVLGLSERLRSSEGLLIAAASVAPGQLGLTLPDLTTRLTWGPVYPLQTLSDDQKLAALQLRANRLGLELPAEVARYVLARYPRDMASLFAWLDRTDRQAFVSQRRLTIPFVRELERG